MTRAAPTKLSVEKDFRFWPFHEMSMNHIENMDWIKYLDFTESGTYYNIAKKIGWVKTETIEIDFEALEISTQTTDIIKKLKLQGLYTWLLNSSNEWAQDFLAKENDNHHRYEHLAWKLLTTKILHEVKQGICRAQNIIHTLSLDKFDSNIKSLVKSLKGNRKLLAS